MFTRFITLISGHCIQCCILDVTVYILAVTDYQNMGKLILLCVFSALMDGSIVSGSGDRTSWWKFNKILPGPIHSVGGIGEEWSHKVLLDGKYNVRAQWKNDYDEYGNLWIIMQISAKTKGYIGIGFSPLGAMTDADIAIGWVDDDGTPHLKDFYGVENGLPFLDEKQDYILLGGMEEDGQTVITFKRKWDTCDDEHDMQLDKDTTRLIWSVGKQDPQLKLGKPSHLYYHGVNRGVQSVFLYHDSITRNFPKPGEKDIKNWDMTMNNVEFSTPNTTYHCRIEKFPDTGKKHHMIGWEPIIQPENIKNVHHIIMYECFVPGHRVKEFDHYASIHRGGTCYTKNMPYIWGQSCTGFLVVWLVGWEGDMLPAHVGAVLGQQHGGATYFMVEMHYENPEGMKVIDNSGIRIYYTDKLREYDGSTIVFGHRHSPFQLIPPKQKDFLINGICGKECLQKTLPPEGMHIVSLVIHAHLWGTRMKFRHFRNGTELPTIYEEKHYDFNYQQSRTLKEERVVLPGDELLTECHYNTEDMTEPVLGGLSTDQEMCQVFLFYYPKIEIGMCNSQPEFHDFMRGLGIHNNLSGDILKEIHMPYDPTGQELEASDTAKEVENYGEGLSYKGLFGMINIDGKKMTVADHMNRMNWDDPQVGKRVEEYWTNGKHYQFCTAEGSRRIPLENHIMDYPVINEPYKPPAKKRKCSELEASGARNLLGSCIFTIIISLTFPIQAFARMPL